MNSLSHLPTTFAALADPTRLAIVARLAQSEATVNELAEPFSMSQPAISKHLKVLERAGLIARGRDAQRRPCRLIATPLRDVEVWLEEFRNLWENSLAAMDEVLEDLKEAERNEKNTKRKKGAR